MADLIKLSKGNVDFEGVKWVLKAITRGDKFNIVEIKDGQCTATDGNRLHTYKLEGAEYTESVYSLLINKAKEIILQVDTDRKFPEWSVIVPEHKDYQSFTSQWDKGNSRVLSCNFAQVIRLMKTNTINIQYLDDALSSGSFDIYYYADDKPIMCEGGNMKAFIMPMEV